MPHSRRQFVKNAAYLGLGFSGLRIYACGGSRPAVTPMNAAAPVGYGSLTRDRLGMLDLPEGFTYRIISREGETMADGLRVPGLADGMGTFEAPDGRVIIVRNHEVAPTQTDHGAFAEGAVAQTGIDPADFFDYGSGKLPALGGTSTIVYDETAGRVDRQFMSLLGTTRNCAGGVMPWGSWLTCEEDVTLKGSHSGTAEKTHGFVFEVPATVEPSRARPLPIEAMGRFNHEAVACDPGTGIVYLTEDRDDGLLYRFIPNRQGALHEGGRLQALVVVDHHALDTRNWPENPGPGASMDTRYDVTWVDINNVLSPRDDLRYQGASRGAAVFARGEGMWYGEGVIYFACTSGGRTKTGQLLKLSPATDGGVLELFIEPNNSDIMKSCDNLTISPSGEVMVCEDDLDPYIRGVTPDGQIYTFAHNVGHRSEFAGICFSPSGRTMFVNIQVPGLTLAVTGPFNHL